MAFERKILMDACPKCGKQPIVLVDIPGREPFAACEDRACKTYLGLDADQRPVVLVEACASCGKKSLTRGKFGAYCMACGAKPTSKGGVEPAAASEKPAPVAGGNCPKCKVGLLRVRPSQYSGFWAACGNRDCGLKYDCDAQGVALGGICVHCGGPVKRLKDGRKGPCAACEKWQDPTPTATRPTRPAAVERPPDARCPYCSEALKTVKTKKGDWVYRCDPCDKWIQVEVDDGSE